MCALVEPPQGLFILKVFVLNLFKVTEFGAVGFSVAIDLTIFIIFIEITVHADLNKLRGC